MEEDIIYYLFKGEDIAIFKKIFNAFTLKSLQTEIYIEGDNYWCPIYSLDDFINSYKKGNFSMVLYSVESDCDINIISFSYMFDGYLLVGFSTEDSTKIDFIKIEYLFGDIKFVAKKITTEKMPFKNRESFFK